MKEKGKTVMTTEYDEKADKDNDAEGDEDKEDEEKENNDDEENEDHEDEEHEENDDEEMKRPNSVVFLVTYCKIQCIALVHIAPLLQSLNRKSKNHSAEAQTRPQQFRENALPYDSNISRCIFNDLGGVVG